MATKVFLVTLLLTSLLTFSLGEIQEIEENQEVTFSLVSGAKALYYVKNNAPNTNGILKVDWSPVAGNLEVYVQANVIGDQISNKLTSSPAYVTSSGGVDNNNAWYIHVVANGGAVTSGTLKANTMATTNLVSGTAMSVSVNGTEKKLYKLPAPAGSVKIEFTNTSGDIEVYAAAGVIALSKINVSPTILLASGFTDQIDWYVVVSTTTNTPSTGTITLTAKATVALTSGVASAPVSIGEGEYALFKLAGAPGQTGLVVSDYFYSGNGSVQVFRTYSTIPSPSGPMVNDSITNAQTDDVSWWIVATTNTPGGVTGVSVSVTSYATQTVTSGTTVTGINIVSGRKKLYKLAATANAGGAVKVQYTVTNSTLSATASNVNIRALPVGNNTIAYSSTTDNVDWYFMLSAPISDVTDASFTVTTYTTTAITSATLNTVALGTNDCKIYKLAGIKDTTGVVHVSLNGNFSLFGYSSVIAKVPVSDNHWYTASAFTDDRDWWFIASSTNTDAAGDFKITAVPTISLTNATTNTFDIQQNEIKLFASRAQPLTGGAINVNFTNDVNVYVNYGAIPVLLGPINDGDYKWAPTDNVTWYIVVTPLAGNTSNSSVVGSLVDTHVLSSGVSSGAFNIPLGGYRIYYLPTTDHDTGVVRIQYAPGTTGPYLTIYSNPTSISTTSAVTSTGLYWAARGFTDTTGWWFVATPHDTYVIGATLTVTSVETEFFCDPAIDCGGHGTCAANGKSCVCQDPYGGTWCDCDPAVTCSNAGICQVDGTCKCNQDHEGVNCEIDNDATKLISSFVTIAMLLFVLFY